MGLHPDGDSSGGLPERRRLTHVGCSEPVYNGIYPDGRPSRSTAYLGLHPDGDLSGVSKNTEALKVHLEGVNRCNANQKQKCND